MIIEPIGYFSCAFKRKFGIPRQSGLIPDLSGKVVLKKEWSDVECIRGLDSFDYIWLLWGFSNNRHKASGSTVRPPLLGGNQRMGVFATRSPYRPSPLGLSSVRMQEIKRNVDGLLEIHVLGADLQDRTPIYDIKPYLEYSDSHTGVRCGFVDNYRWERLEVEFTKAALGRYTPEEIKLIGDILELDPRPHYQDKPDKTYGMEFGDKDIHFRIADGRCLVL